MGGHDFQIGKVCGQGVHSQGMNMADFRAQSPRQAGSHAYRTPTITNGAQ